jgi:tetratricopeptide (TPR) repeat protein
VPPPVPRRPPPPAPPPPSAGPPAADESDVAIPLDLDAPDVDDAPGEADLLAPRPDVAIDLPTPRGDGGSDLPAPRANAAAESTDLPAPAADPATDLPRPRAGGARKPVKPDLEPVVPDAPDAPDLDAPPDKPPKGRNMIVIGGVGAVVAAASVAAYVLVGGSSAHRDLDTKLSTARRAIAEDTAAGLQAAVAVLRPLTTGDKPNDDAVTVEAQLHLQLARLGVAGELAAGRALLDRTTDAPASVERHRAEGLRAVVMGDLANARKTLKEILSTSTSDAVALSYLGWAELMARDPATAAGDFSRAVGAEATRAQAAYGLGLAKERSGDGAAARQAYAKVVAAVPEHVRAQLGILRLDARGGDAAVAGKLEVFIAEHTGRVTPREQAEGLVAIGQVALEAGRRDEAEDRFNKALAIDPDAATSLAAADARLGLARARIEAGRGAEVVEELRKILAVDARGVEVRELLTEALLDKQDTQGAEVQLAAAEKIAAKDARLAFLRGRLLLAHTTIAPAEREQAIARFREATTADPKLLVAWAALARNLHELGRTREAVEALDKAAGELSADARGAAMLGAAYLAIGRPADAEARFRAVLAADAGKPATAERLPVRMGLGEALEAQNKLDDADAAYAEAQKIAPKSGALLERRGRLAVRRGKLEDANALYDEAIKLGNPTIGLRVAAGELAFKTNHLPEARTLIESAIKDDDRSAAATLLLARIEAATNHPNEALGLARRAATLQDMPEAHLLLAQLLEGLNKLEAAAAEFNLARKPPVVEEASLGRARILVRMGATKDALVALDPLAKVGGVRADALLLEGDCYTDLQQADKARHAYEDAARLAPNSADVVFKMGRAELDAGKRKPGIDALEHAVKVGDAKASWMADAYLLIGDARRQGKENDAAVKAYTKYLQLAPPSAPMRAEATRQITLLGGTPPAAP